MEGDEDIDNCNEEIDDYYVVDAWSAKQGCSLYDKNSKLHESPGLSSNEESSTSRRKPTEGEIDEFLKNLKEINSIGGSSGLEGDDNHFNSTDPTSKIIEIPGESCRDKLYPEINQIELFSSTKQFNSKYNDSIQRSSTVSYKPGGTVTKTFFPDSSVKSNDLCSSIVHNQGIGISSCATLFCVSFHENQDSGGDFSDLKGANVPSESTYKDRSPHHSRRLRSRSPHKNSAPSKHLLDRDIRISSQEKNKNYSKMDISRSDRNIIRDRRHFEDVRRLRRSRSRSRSKERFHHIRRSYRRSLSLSPPPHERRHRSKDKMEPRQFRNLELEDRYGPEKTIVRPSQGFVNSNMHSNMGIKSQPNPPVQYPVNNVSSRNSYGRFPAYNPQSNNMVNNGPSSAHGFQPPIGQIFPQSQYPQPQNYQGYNSGLQMGMQGNTSNPTMFPPPWNQISHGFDQNYMNPNLPANAVMYPHIKIGQTRMDAHPKNFSESPEGPPQHKRLKCSSEKPDFSRSISPESRNFKRKSAKMHINSPTLNSKYETSDTRYERGDGKSPMIHSRFDSKKPKVIIDPNRIPTPPPPPIMGRYEKDDLKSNTQKMKIPDRKTNNDTSLSGFLNKEKVSLSCLLEAVMENSGQGKSQLSDPKVKKEITSKCESKIRHLYKKRMTGLGAFFPEPVVKSSRVNAHLSPLVAAFSDLTYNCNKENDEWQCPGIIIPKVKTKEKEENNDRFRSNDFPDHQLHPDGSSRIGIENVNVIPTLINDQPLPNGNWNNNRPPNNFMNVNENNQHNTYPYQNSQGWVNPAPLQGPYSVQQSVLSHLPEIPALRAPFVPPGYPPYSPVAPRFLPPQQGYPPRPEMLNYPMRPGYHPMQTFPSQNLSHPRMYKGPQPVQTNTKPSQGINFCKPSGSVNKNKNKNLVQISLSCTDTNSHLEVIKENIQKDKISSCRIDLTGKDIKIQNLDVEDNKISSEKNEAKDKLLRKLWQKRKSSDYVHLPADQQGAKEHEDDGFYKKLKYPEMLEDTQMDSIHEYQLTNLRERIESCLAEGKVPPEHERSRYKNRGDGDRDRERDRLRDWERGKDRARERERLRREPNDIDRKRLGKSSPGDEKKKYRPSEDPQSRIRSRDTSSNKEHSNKSNKDEVIEVLSDEDRNRKKGSDSNNEKEIVEPSKKLLAIILDVLAPEIRKTQVKSNLYQSIISSLEKEEKTYKRLYFLKNTALIKSEKDKQMRMVVPRDNLKDVITIIHKNFHDVQVEELARLLRVIVYPNMLHLSKCISKVVSECPTCIEQKRKKDSLKDKKTDKVEKKPEKRIEKSVRDKEKERLNSADKEKRIIKDKSSSNGRWEPPRSGKERNGKESSVNDGRPPGYEKATKIKKSIRGVSEKSNKPSDNKQSIIQPEENASAVLHELSDKALEFKHPSDASIEKTVDTENSNLQTISVTNCKFNENTVLPAGNLYKIDSGKKNQEIEIDTASSFEDTKINETTVVSVVSGTISDFSVVTSEKGNPVCLSVITEDNTKNNISIAEVNKNDSKKTTTENIHNELERTKTAQTIDKEEEKTTTVKKEEEKTTTVKKEEEKPITTENVDVEVEKTTTVDKEEEKPITTENVDIEVEKTTTVDKEEEKPITTENIDKEVKKNTTVDKEEEKPITTENVDKEVEKTTTVVKEEERPITTENMHKEKKRPITTENTHKEEEGSLMTEKADKESKTAMITENSHKLSEETITVENKVNKKFGETTTEVKPNVETKKETRKLDFKGKVRQVQLSSDECKFIILALESKNNNKSVDPAYLIKGGMLCKKTVSSVGVTEVKIVAPSDKLEEFVDIVHTMSAVHTSAPKVAIFFTKHFTQVDNLDLEVNKFVNKCSYCKIKIS